jgi:hypothetical protein
MRHILSRDKVKLRTIIEIVKIVSLQYGIYSIGIQLLC